MRDKYETHQQQGSTTPPLLQSKSATSTDLKQKKRMTSPENTGWQKVLHTDVFLKNPVPMVIIRPSDAHCVDINESFTKLTGYKYNDLIEKNFATVGILDEEDADVLLKEINHKKQVDPAVISFKCKDGKLKHCIFDTSKIKSSGVYYLLVSITNIKELTETGNWFFPDKGDLLEGSCHNTFTNDRFYQLAENAKDVVYRMTLPDGQYEYINPASTEIIGYTPEEHYLNPLLVQDLIHPDYKNYFLEQWEKLTDGNPPSFYEYKIIHKSGSERWLHQKNVLIRDETGCPVAIEGIIRDVTEQKRLEEALRESESKYRVIADNTYNWEFWLNPDGDFVYSSPSCKRITGYEASEFLRDASLMKKIIHPKDQRIFLEHRSAVIAEKSLKETTFRIIHRDGSERWIGHVCQTVFDRNGRFLGTRGSYQDITTQKIYENYVRNNEEKYRGLFEKSRDAILMVQNNVVIDANEAAVNLFGFASKEKILSRHMGELSPPIQSDGVDSISGVNHRIEKVLEEGKNLFFEWLHNRADGETFLAEVQLCKVDLRDKVIVQAIIRDISNKKQIEADLQKSEERFRALAENAPIAIILIEPDQTFYYANPSYKKIFGYTLNDTPDCATAFEKFYPDPGYREEIIAGWNVTRPPKNWRVKSVSTSRVQCKDGSCKTVQTISNVLADKKCLLLFLDVTDLEDMHQMLERNRKLESIGTLAGGIAHDFNNLLATILGYIQLAKTDDQAKKSTLKQLLAAEWALHQSAELTHRLMTFAKGGEPLKKSCDLGEILRDELYKIKLDNLVNKSVQIDQDLRPVLVDEAQIRQVIRNLITNAVEAMEAGGDLTVGANCIAINAEDRLPVKEGFYIRIYIKDSGKGIPAKNLPLIFDPYFSTKGRGARKGMGLGLSVAFSIVNKHDGYITVESTEGNGTTFYVYLPTSHKITRVESTTGAPDDCRGRVLIMDDDPFFVEALKDMVCALGCEVTVAKDGFEAVDLYREADEKHGGHFDLVILDLTIKGGLGGKLTMEKLQTIDPGVKAIICSGYSNDPIIENYGKFGFMGALPKPFDIRILKTFIDKAIAKP